MDLNHSTCKRCANRYTNTLQIVTDFSVTIHSNSITLYEPRKERVDINLNQFVYQTNFRPV